VKSRLTLTLLLVALIAVLGRGAGGSTRVAVAADPIIDVHMHALSATAFASSTKWTCATPLVFLPRDPRDAYGPDQFASCDKPLQAPSSDAALLSQTLEMMSRYNITAVVSGPVDAVRRWREAAPDKFIPGIMPDPRTTLDALRTLMTDGSVRVLGELGYQYAGQRPTDPTPDSYFALAEELDIPVGVHVGPGAPGAPYIGYPKFEMQLGNPLLFEAALVKHPKLRLYVMHAGWPMSDQIVALLYAHPQVYVDISLIDWFIPRPEFHMFLRRLIGAGFEKRIMFGSDLTFWPGAIPIAVQSITSADFLSAGQKRDILYNNAARFLRLDHAR